ncbi:MAG: DJ-1/PfpI family protein [Archangium sp.]|nr:DJ-1/PfpI family protein [Archangium sp.]
MHVLMVIAPQDFRDEELRVPKTAFELAGRRVTVASTRVGVCVSIAGRTIEVSLALPDTRCEDYAAVVFVGGAGATCLFDDPHAHRIARELYAQGALVTAICIAPTILARAGLLQEVEATAFPSEREELAQAGAKFIEAPVVTAGRVITADGPAASEAFAARILSALGA